MMDRQPNVKGNLQKLNNKDVKRKDDLIHKKQQQENVQGNFSRESVIFILLAVFATVTYKILEIITAAQPRPYLDEICHIPQAQEYCRGNFTYWDHRITTLPGVYLLSVGVLRPLSLWREKFLCDSFNLRLTNVFLSVCNFMLYIWLVDQLHSGTQYKWKRVLSAVNLAIFPPLYFFSFLYYTDVAAVCLMLLVFVLHLSGHNVFAAFTAIISILMRQTNIVWTAFCAARAVDLVLKKYFVAPEDNNPMIINSWRQIPVIFKGLLRFFSQPFRKWFELYVDVFRNVFPYIVVAILFAVFVVWNGGLVVGDRSAHTPTIHVPQMFYFFAFLLFFAFPHFCKYVFSFLRAASSRWLLSLAIVIVITIIIHYNTLVHPYLLSDNRHYIFYVWMRFFEHRAYGRYVFFPAYMFGAVCAYQTMKHKQSFLVTAAFFACCALALVPQKLLECRYFIIPFVLTRLHVKPESWVSLFLESTMYIAINAVTIYLFLTKAFPWPDTDELQRIMW